MNSLYFNTLSNVTGLAHVYNSNWQTATSVFTFVTGLVLQHSQSSPVRHFSGARGSQGQGAGTEKNKTGRLAVVNGLSHGQRSSHAELVLVFTQ